MIDTADHIKHIPSGEEWLVAFVEDGRLCACGWPCSYVPVEDCVLVKKATEAERFDLLQQMASMSGGDPRKSYAIRMAAGALASRPQEETK